MTRKDYVLIAEGINSVRCEMQERGQDPQGAYEVASRLAHRLRCDNDRFERARFMRACGFAVEV